MKKIFYFMIFVLSFGFTFLIEPTTNAYADTLTYFNPICIARYNNKFFVLDKGTGTDGHKLVIQDSSSVITIGGYGYNDEKLVSPSLFCMNDTNIFIYTANNDGATNYIIKNFNYNGDFISSYSTYTDVSNNTMPLGATIADFTCDAFGNAYFLDLSHSTIIKKSFVGEDKLIEYKVEGFVYNASTRILGDILGNIYFVNTNSVVKIDTKSKETTTYTLPSSIVTTNIDIDCNGTLYSFVNGTNSFGVSKIKLGDIVTIDEYNIACETTPISYSIDKATGIVYYFDNQIKSITLTHNNENIVSAITSFTPPSTHISEVPLTQSVTIAQPKVATAGYRYPYFVNPITNFSTSDYIYIIGEEGCFNICLVTNKSASNIITYVYKDYLQVIDVPDVSEELNTKVISSPTATAYRYPSSLSASSSTATPIKTSLLFTYNTEVTVTKSLVSYPDYNNMKFVEVKIDNKYYYINIAALSDKTPPQTNGVKIDACVSIKDDSQFIALYLLVDDKYEESGITLNNGVRIKLNDFDKNLDYNSITY